MAVTQEFLHNCISWKNYFSVINFIPNCDAAQPFTNVLTNRKKKRNQTNNPWA